MLLKDIPSIYKALCALQDPYKVVVLDTKEGFFRDDCAARYVAFCRQQNIDIVRVDPSEIAQHQQEMQEPYSLFQHKQLYVVEDLSSLKETKMDELVHALGNMRDGSHLLAIEQGNAHKSLGGLAEARGAYLVIPAMRPWDKAPFVMQWIFAYCKKRMRTISSTAASLLANHFQNNYYGLVTELEKLVTGCENSSCITEKDLQMLGEIAAQPSIFAFFDALLQKDHSAMATFLMSSQEPLDIGLLRFVRSQLEKLIVLVESGAESKTKSQGRQVTIAMTLGRPVLTKWINEIQMYEVDIRCGRKEINVEALLLFFISLTLR